MIPIYRGAEPSALADVRVEMLTYLRGLNRVPTSKDVTGYREASVDALWRSQYKKCAWCEDLVRKKYNDVDHYRPKGEADRNPGCQEQHGYWWLAFSWYNLLFACPTCNRSYKRIKFPLDHGSVPLQAEDSPPGDEKPLLLDPSQSIHPADHISFRVDRVENWLAHPRDSSDIGWWTIFVLGLNSQGVVESRSRHIRMNIQPQADSLRRALERGDDDTVKWEWYRALSMLRAGCAYVAASGNAFRHFVSDSNLEAREMPHWPAPGDLPWGGI